MDTATGVSISWRRLACRARPSRSGTTTARSPGCVRSDDWVRLRRGAYARCRAVGLEQRQPAPAAAHAGRLPRGPDRRAALAHDGRRLARRRRCGSSPTCVHLTRTDGRAGRAEAGIRQHRGHLAVTDVTPTRRPVAVTRDPAALDSPRSPTSSTALVVNGLAAAPRRDDDRPAAHVTASHKFWPDTAAQRSRRPPVRRAVRVRGRDPQPHLCWAMRLPAPEPAVPDQGPLGPAWSPASTSHGPRSGSSSSSTARRSTCRYRRPGESVTDAVLREKRREERIRELTGWTCIRITWADLYDPERTAARIRAVMPAAQRAA